MGLHSGASEEKGGGAAVQVDQGVQDCRGGAPISPIKESPKIPTFKAPEIPTLFLSRLLNFRQLIFFSFSVKIGHFEGPNKGVCKVYKIKVKGWVSFYCMDQYFCTQA